MDEITFMHIVSLVCKKIYYVFDVPVLYFDENNVAKVLTYAKNMVPPHIDDRDSYLLEIFKETEYGIMPVVKKTDTRLYYISLNLHYRGQYYGRIMVGPTLKRTMHLEDMKVVFKDVDYNALVSYFSSVKIIFEEAYATYFGLCMSMIDEVYDYLKSTWMSPQKRFIMDRDGQQIQEIVGQKIYWHTGVNIEKIIFECIKRGYPDELKKHIDTYWENTTKKELLTDDIRDQKNFSILFISTLIQAAIEGGLDFQYASKYCLNCISLVEKKASINELRNLNIEVSFDLANRILLLKRKNQTKLIRDCKDYINENIFAELKIYEIATIFHLNDKYLTTRFKEETKETLKNYITRKKVEQAKRMIQTSDINLSEIATCLSFTDQSHFTKIFKKYASMTPYEYKRKIKS